MGNVVSSLLSVFSPIGGAIIAGQAQDKAAKNAARDQAAALAVQERESRSAEEDAAASVAQNQSAATRIAQSAGRRVLAFQGVDTGVTNNQTQPLATTLGGG